MFSRKNDSPLASPFPLFHIAFFQNVNNLSNQFRILLWDNRKKSDDSVVAFKVILEIVSALGPAFRRNDEDTTHNDQSLHSLQWF